LHARQAIIIQISGEDVILSFISNQPRKGNRSSGAAIDCDYACHLLANYISKARLIFKKITDANKMGIPGSR